MFSLAWDMFSNLTFATGLLTLCLLLRSSAKFPNFYVVSILVLLVLATYEDHQFHRATQPFTGIMSHYSGDI